MPPRRAGLLVVETPSKLSLQASDASGIHSSQLDYSFPQRFREAFEAEVELFVKVGLKDAGATWPVGAADCVAAQAIASACAASAAAGEPLLFEPPAPQAAPVALRQVGHGSFGAYMQSIAAAMPRRYRLLAPFTRSSGMSWSGSVTNDGAVDAVYICTPDALHQPMTVACLQAGKHVLVEKPVHPDFASCARAAVAAGRVLMVGFHRRYDQEFIRLKQHVDRVAAAAAAAAGGGGVGGAIKHVVVESRDPVPADARMGFVLRNSVCHDVDMLCWLFPASTLTFAYGAGAGPAVVAANSTINLAGTVQHPDGSTTSVAINYCKEHPSYVQRVTVDSQCFGYDHHAPYPADGGCAALFKDAYAAQWRAFHTLVHSSGGGSAGCKAAQAELLRGYQKTFDCLEQAASVLSLPPLQAAKL